MARARSPQTYSDKRSLVANEVMSCPVVTATEKTAIKAIAKKMKAYDTDTVVIINDLNEPIGMITEGDIVRRLLSRKHSTWFLKAKHVMSKPVLTVGESAAVEDVAKYMVSNKVKRLCVVNERKKLLGLVTQTDIIKNASYQIDVLREIIETNHMEEEAIPSQGSYGFEEKIRHYAKE